MALPTFGSIDSPRLSLRRVVEADLPDLLLVNGDAEVTRYLPYATWQSLDDGAAWLRRIEATHAAGSGEQLVMVRRDDARVVGSVLLFKHDEGSARVELGYVLGRAHWNQSLAQEAVVAACGHAFNALGIRRIEAEVNPDNLASNRLLQRIGFTREGTLRQRWVAKGETYDTHIYGCLADEWRRFWSAVG
jgi:[ribosomal protein S5]-alanine N-acetyltransferase